MNPKGSSENKGERRMIMNVYLMPLFIIIHTVYCFIMLHSLVRRGIITNFIAIMALSTLDLSNRADCEEDDESLGYLRGIRILRNSNFCSTNTMPFPSLLLSSLLLWVVSLPARRRKPLKCSVDHHPIVLPINP